MTVTVRFKAQPAVLLLFPDNQQCSTYHWHDASPTRIPSPGLVQVVSVLVRVNLALRLAGLAGLPVLRLVLRPAQPENNGDLGANRLGTCQ
jgi:hypothetical protein